MDRLTGLTVFSQVVESGGFSAAARRLNMSTTMVSNHVQALEGRLGARLLNRTTRRVNLTDVGRAYYERCRRILADLEEADQAAGLLQSTVRGTLRLYTGAHLVPFIAPVVIDFLARYPEASVDLNAGERNVDMIEEGLDLAIRAVQPPEANLILRRLVSWHHILCCAPSYLERHGAPRQLQDLKRHNCLRFSLYPFGEEWHFVGPGAAQVSVRVSGNLVTNSATTMMKAALAGQGIMMAASFLGVADDLRAGRLVRLLPDHKPIDFAINATYPTRHHLSSKVRAFLDLAADHMARHRQELISD
ncbi:LysR family transcriptional regulator [Enhydrobacter sp.]|jgi:DNA-binding transcriptional LysR family regulator|uniref:LysR family transcriptional regulator n=1 Tax=Enhydrobacter sp. TaxID=1894999 RepID=UPI002617B17A|nr:LysR family transcriptional regulator [Enhydrobacter sp.]WIM12205.1 MAG: Transcriptional regulator, LysR family [Enhydrobacter sp.]